MPCIKEMMMIMIIIIIIIIRRRRRRLLLLLPLGLKVKQSLYRPGQAVRTPKV
jgi:hypothetical protein